MKRKNENTIMAILTQAAKDKGQSLLQFHKGLTSTGMKITYASFYSYCSGTIIPPFEVWAELNQKLKLGLKNDQLLEIFNDSKLVAKESNKLTTCVINLHLRTETIDKKYRNNDDKFKLDLEKRANETFMDQLLADKFKVKGDRKTSAYIAYLIDKDFKENNIWTITKQKN